MQRVPLLNHHPLHASEYAQRINGRSTGTLKARTIPLMSLSEEQGSLYEAQYEASDGQDSQPGFRDAKLAGVSTSTVAGRTGPGILVC